MTIPPLTRDPWPLSRRAALVLLGLLLAYLAAWDLRAVLWDNRLGATDTTLDDLLTLLGRVDADGLLPGLTRWFAEARKGPLSGLLSGLVYLAVGDPLLAPRLLGVLLHQATLLLVYALTLRVARSRATALVSVAICGTFVGQYGWFRTDSHEGPLTVLTVLALLLLVRGLTRWRDALWRGLVGALGMWAKPAFPLFVLGPAVVMVVWTVRSRLAVGRVVLAAALAAGLWALWLVPNLSWMGRYASESSNVVQLSEKIGIYLSAIPASVPFYGAGLAAALLCLVARSVPAYPVVLIAAGLFGGLGLLVKFDPWVRYQVPAFPLCAVLVGLGLHSAADLTRGSRWGRTVGRASAVLVVLLLGIHARDNLAGVYHPEGNREWGAGLVKPDTRPYQAYPEAVRYVHARLLEVFYVYGWPPNRDLVPLDTNRLWIRRGFRMPVVSPREVADRLRAGRWVYLVYAHPLGGPMPICQPNATNPDPDADAALDRTTVLGALLTTTPQDAFSQKLRDTLRACDLRVVRCFFNPDGQLLAVIEAHRHTKKINK